MPRPEDTEWRKPIPRSPAPQIDPVFLWPTPNNADFLFFVERNGDLPANQKFKYGDQYPDRGRYPDHKLVYVTPQADDKWSRWYYASDRINQDAYNWEFTAADIGGTRYDSVTRTYMVFRAAFDPETPAMGSPMPNIPEDLFSAAYILASRAQKRTGEQELDSLYVIEQRTYVKRCTLTEIVGSRVSSEDRLYYKGEEIDGVAVEDLFDDPTNVFWEVQSDGSSKIGKQLSCDWYSISTQRELDIHFIWPTPEQSDFLFYVVRSSTTNPETTADYGDSFGGDYADHKLVHVSPTDERGRSKFYYAADRINQDDYNWQINGGNELTRTYVTLREDYEQSGGVGTPDIKFDQYVFAEESVLFGDEILNGLFIAVQKRFLQKETTEYTWAKNFESYIKITKEVIASTPPTEPTVVAGKIEEIKNVNSFYSIKITQELVNEFPYEKTAVPNSVNINFPNRLRDIELLRAWAWADSAGAAIQYDEDSNYKYTIDVPRAGPYSATIRRFITDDPEAVMAEYPLTKIPVAQIDTVTEVWAWWYASNEGNMARAKANTLQLPSTIHDTLEIEPNYPDLAGNFMRESVLEIPETPGYTEFVSATTAVLQHNVKEMDMKLFEVSVVEVDITDLYPA